MPAHVTGRYRTLDGDEIATLVAALAALSVLVSACTGSNAVDQTQNGTFKFGKGAEPGEL